LWRAAASAGFDVRILDKGEVAAAASPDLPGSVFNRAFGMRQVPIHRPRMEALFADAGTTGWLVAGIDDPRFAGREADWPVGVHAGSMSDVLARSTSAARPVVGLEIRRVDPADATVARRWADLFVAGFGIEGPLADAWRRFNPLLVGAKGYQQFIGALDGRDVAASAMFNRRRVAWLGAGTVLPDARGRGIQRALIADRARRSAEAGSTRILSTAETGTISAANLDALGIHRIWTRGHYRVDPTTGPGVGPDSSTGRMRP
jgi:ribosomal protein S18 acetylase RimI-like enzyme